MHYGEYHQFYSSTITALGPFFLQINDSNQTFIVGMLKDETEMCLFLMLYWVEGKDRVEPQFCYTEGPPKWTWAKNTTLKNLPNEEASLLLQ